MDSNSYLGKYGNTSRNIRSISRLSLFGAEEGVVGFYHAEEKGTVSRLDLKSLTRNINQPVNLDIIDGMIYTYRPAVCERYRRTFKPLFLSRFHRESGDVVRHTEKERLGHIKKKKTLLPFMLLTSICCMKHMNPAQENLWERFWKTFPSISVINAVSLISGFEPDGRLRFCVHHLLPQPQPHESY